MAKKVEFTIFLKNLEKMKKTKENEQILFEILYRHNKIINQEILEKMEKK